MGKAFLLGFTQGCNVGGQLSEEIRVTSVVLHGSVLGPLLFLAYVNDIWRTSVSTIRLFANDCVIQGVPGGMCQTSGECSLC